MIDHISIAVPDAIGSRAFYAAALAPLGMVCIAEADGWYGFGAGTRATFWFGEDDWPQRPMHLAFTATGRQMVDDFYFAALAAGGRDNGAPGLRLRYHAHYYAAFVTCLNGHNLEAVCHRPVA